MVVHRLKYNSTQVAVISGQVCKLPNDKASKDLFNISSKITGKCLMHRNPSLLTSRLLKFSSFRTNVFTEMRLLSYKLEMLINYVIREIAACQEQIKPSLHYNPSQ